MNQLRKYGRAFLHLFLPDTCLICGQTLIRNEKTVCYRCIAKLEPSRYNDFVDNEIAYLFEGRVPVTFATAGFRYHKEGLLQQLIFQLKYHYHKEIGQILGRELGASLENTPLESVDFIIPVPLHPNKQRKRGYNQSERIAIGIAEVLALEVRTDVLLRKKDTISQTKKSRMERFENMEDVFSVKNADSLEGMHILLVDDIVTTGSTLIGCASALHRACKNVKISVACLAKAD